MSSSSPLRSEGSGIVRIPGLGSETASKTEMLHVSFTGAIIHVCESELLPNPGPKTMSGRIRSTALCVERVHKQPAYLEVQLPSKQLESTKLYASDICSTGSRTNVGRRGTYKRKTMIRGVASHTFSDSTKGTRLHLKLCCHTA